MTRQDMQVSLMEKYKAHLIHPPEEAKEMYISTHRVAVHIAISIRPH